MKSFIIAFSLLLLMFTACTKQPAQTKPAAIGIKTISFDELFGNKYSITTAKLSVEGLCVHVCKHSGKKIFIIGTDPNNKFQVFAGEGISGFPLELEGSRVRVTGILEEEKLDMKAVAQMESELKEEEKDKINSKEGSCAFEQDMKKIADLRNKITKSPKGYFSLYSMTAVEYKKL